MTSPHTMRMQARRPSLIPKNMHQSIPTTNASHKTPSNPSLSSSDLHHTFSLSLASVAQEVSGRVLSRPAVSNGNEKDCLCGPRGRRLGHLRTGSWGPCARPCQCLLHHQPRCWVRDRGLRPLLLCLVLAVGASRGVGKKERSGRLVSLTSLLSLFFPYFLFPCSSPTSGSVVKC